MWEISKDFARGAEWIAAAGIQLSPDLRSLSDTFTFLQQERHEADYNLEGLVTRPRCFEVIERATDALAIWREIRNSTEADFFLLALLLGRPRRS